MRQIFALTLLVVLLLSCRFLNAPQVQPTRSDPVTNFSPDDAEMNAAIQQARETLPLFIKAFQSPTATQTAFLIKAKFPYGSNGAAEHMWIGDLSYSEDIFQGTLENEPVYVQGIQFGDPVTVKTEDISDWMIIDDNRLLGGFTLHVIRNKMSEEERKQFDANLGFEVPETPELP